jgi:heterodisulfide reductase subunit B
MRQGDIEAASNEKFNLPIFYFTQLLGLALGLPAKELGLRSLIVDPRPLLTEKGMFPQGMRAGSAEKARTL